MGTDVKWSSGQVVSFINYQQPWSPVEAKLIKATVDCRQYLASPILGYIGAHVSCYKSSESLLLDEALRGEHCDFFWRSFCFLFLCSLFLFPQPQLSGGVAEDSLDVVMWTHYTDFQLHVANIS